MPNDPRVRASDADRDKTAALLREHHAAGRLTAEEFSSRLDATYAATTVGELAEILADLPEIDLYELPETAMRRSWARSGAGPPMVTDGSHTGILGLLGRWLGGRSPR